MAAVEVATIHATYDDGERRVIACRPHEVADVVHLYLDGVARDRVLRPKTISISFLQSESEDE